MTTPQPAADPYAAVNNSINTAPPPAVTPAANDPEYGTKQSAGSDYIEVDFWGAAKEYTFELPGQENVPEHLRQAIFYQSMNEGARARFQKKTNRPIKIDQDDNSASLNVDQASDRHALFETCITGWSMRRGGQPLEYKPYLLQQWLKVADPEIVDKLERAIRENNPWMINEMSSEAIDKEIQRLEARKVEAIAREESEANFGSK